MSVPTEIVPLPVGGKWKLRKLTYNVFQASIVSIDVVVGQSENAVTPMPRTERRRRTSNDARNKWIYEQCCKGVPYDTIALRLNKMPKSWERIESKQGIRAAASRYAAAHDLPPIPPRQGK